MKIEYITIDAGQRFDAVMPEIPTNSIINKTVTGCGATYAEINALDEMQRCEQLGLKIRSHASM